nr:hypothetical protein [Klebsiella pneumoniae]
MNQKYMIYMYLLKARTFIALLLVIAFFSVMVPNFLTASNLLIMTQHVAITGLLAIGMTLVILTGGIDLSVGAVAGICGMVAGALLTNGLPLWNGDILFFNVPEVILCVAIFGVLVGGRGRVTGSIIGAFVIVFLADGMVMMGVSDFWQMVIKGVVIVTAVVVDQFQQKLQSKVILMRRHEEKLAAIPPNGATSS